MTSSLQGKVAFITGAARGQGREHAVTLAQHGANIIALDICKPLSTIPYEMSTSDDLAETVALVEATGQKIVAAEADVRDFDAVQRVVDDGLNQFGQIDIVVANAGVYSFGPLDSVDIELQRWRDIIDINLTGTFHTVKAAVPSMVARGAGGSVLLTSSTAGIRGLRSMADYTATKHGVVGLMRTFANELAPHNIRVNTIHPTGVSTHMVTNPQLVQWYADNPDMANNVSANLLPVDLVEAQDVSQAVLFLASDAARYVTGLEMKVDAGFTERG
ncbi:mycofactocin-coupled SDR family oxidoreductase [Gordonia sp. KTR9]|uniref:mycofactocin-coupled SDR family oxidoreductase n=1 Tax=Gordonia sp. KTR9 TaxID=337191 RepID=UPI00030C9FE7|nr:mycofactocin-coupled SDR family oxidoreductase [Gordonia sp. KTR9]